MNDSKISVKYLFLIISMILYPILPVYFRVGGSIMIYYIVLLPLLFFTVLGKFYNVMKIHFILIYTLGSFLVFSVYMEINELIKFIIAPIGLFTALITIINSEKIFFKIIDTLIYTAGVIGVFGIIQAITSFNIFSLLNNTENNITNVEKRMGILRIQQSFGMSTNYCNYLIIIMALLYYRMCTSDGENKIIYKVIWWLLLLNAFCTGSRGPLVVILVSQFIFLLKVGKKIRWRQVSAVIGVIIMACIVGTFLGLPIINYIKNYFYVFISLIDSSYQSKITIDFGTNLEATGTRIRLYSYIYEAVKNKLAFGIGSNAAKSFEIVVNEWFSKKSIENEYLTTLLVYGVTGLSIQIYFFISNLLYSIRSKRKKLNSEIIGFNFIFIVTFMGYITNLFTVSMQADERIFFVFIGLMLTYNIRIAKKNNIN